MCKFAADNIELIAVLGFLSVLAAIILMAIVMIKIFVLRRQIDKNPDMEISANQLKSVIIFGVFLFIAISPAIFLHSVSENCSLSSYKKSSASQ